MRASALALVSSTGHIHGKLGELTGFHVFEILFHAPLHSPEDADPLSLKPHEGAAPYPAYNNRIHRVAGEGLHGLTLTMRMVGVSVADGFELSARAVENHKRRS